MTYTLIAPDSWAKPLADYDAWLKAGGRPRSTRYQRSYRLRSLASSVGEDPWSVTSEQLLKYVSTEGWGAHYRRSVRSAIRSFYDWAERTERVDRSPARLLPPVPAPTGRPRPIDDEVLTDAINNCDARVRDMLLLGSLVGLRCCEIAQVHSRDLEGSHGRWQLRVHGKGGRVRLVPVSDLVARIVHDAEGYLFPGQIDGHLSAAYVSKLISRQLPTGVTAHQLRHRFATRALRGAGGNLRVVQELLGHASVATTQIYTAVDSDELRFAAMAAA